MPDDAEQEHRFRNHPGNHAGTYAGYRPLLPAEMTSGMGTAAYGYVFLAAVFGVMFGLVIAVYAGRAPGVSSAHTLAPPDRPLPASKVEPTAVTGSTLPRFKHSGHRRKAKAGFDRYPSGGNQGASLRVSFHKKRAVYPFFDWEKNSREHKVKRMPYVSPNAPLAPDEPTALQLATAAAESGPVILGIQGDATVASYDEATGTVQTYEGATYVLAKASSDGNSIAWQDAPFNIHYRCDEKGSCTLSHRGASAIAQLSR